MKYLILSLSFLFCLTAVADPRGVAYESSNQNVLQTNLNQRFATITNTAATASTLAGYDANKKLTTRQATADDLAADSVSASELNAAGVKAELEAILSLPNLQDAVTDAQVPNNITIDLATTATTANAGDSATSFFSSGTIEAARLPSEILYENVAGEIAAITDKATPVAADHLLIEDSEAGNAKKDTTIGALEPALEGVLDLQDQQGAVTDGQVPNTISITGGANITWTDNVRQTFNPGANVAGINVGAIAGDPDTPVDGDMWYNSDEAELRARIDGVTVALGPSGDPGAINWDDILSPTANSTFDHNAFTTGFQTDIDGGTYWTDESTDLDLSSDTVIRKIASRDSDDANLFYLVMESDSAGTPVNDYSFSQTAAVFVPPLTANPTFSGAIGTDDTYQGDQISGVNAGETTAQWDVVFLASDGKWDLADADAAGEFPARGIGVTSGSDTNPLIVLTQGTVRNDAWNWTVGGTLYLSDTAGGLTQTAPSSAGDAVQIVGFAISADIAYFNFTGHWLTVAP